MICPWKQPRRRQLRRRRFVVCWLAKQLWRRQKGLAPDGSGCTLPTCRTSKILRIDAVLPRPDRRCGSSFVEIKGHPAVEKRRPKKNSTCRKTVMCVFGGEQADWQSADLAGVRLIMLPPLAPKSAFETAYPAEGPEGGGGVNKSHRRRRLCSRVFPLSSRLAAQLSCSLTIPKPPPDVGNMPGTCEEETLGRQIGPPPGATA